jgi:lysophospholipase L1-like esterase
MNKGFVSVFIVFAMGIAIAVSFFVIGKRTATTQDVTQESNTMQSSPTPYQFPYKKTVIQKNQSYRIVIVGDSIVASLGPNANTLRLELIKKYPDSEFVTYNYGYPSMSILSLPDRLTKTTLNANEENQSILSQGFELIIIESFGYNPISNLPLSEGLAKQTQILEESVQLILQRKPDAALAFMTPIAMNPATFAKGTYELSFEKRKEWVSERISYIENHKKFAQEKGIHVIDVYKASLKSDGLVDQKYIGADYIHPSGLGIDLISKTIANYIYDNEIFPR